MKKTIGITPFALVFVLTATLLGCRQETGEGSNSVQPVSQQVAGPDLPDTTGASVWSYLEGVGYRDNWALWPEKGQLYTGQEPHGMLLTSYLNDVALEALKTHSGTMPEGAILVKENYMPDSTLAAITVMYKVAGYNPDHADWFFSKHRPDGSVDKAPNGMALEGHVPGCQNCHVAKKANDYVFTSSLVE